MRAAGARAACSQGEDDGDAQESDPYEDQEEECFTQGPVYVNAESVARDDVHGMRVGHSASCTVPPLPARPRGRPRGARPDECERVPRSSWTALEAQEHARRAARARRVGVQRRALDPSPS